MNEIEEQQHDGKSFSGFPVNRGLSGSAPIRRRNIFYIYGRCRRGMNHFFRSWGFAGELAADREIVPTQKTSGLPPF